METFGVIFFSTLAWSMIGLIFLALPIEKVDSFDIFNPKCIYKNFKVNIFGTTILSIVFNLMCPIGAICYWFYKLCTIGRR